MSLFINITLDGLTEGMIFASLALALVLVFRATRIINFAQGAMAMLTTFIASSLLNQGLGYWWAFVAVLVLGFVFGGLIERVLIRPLRGRSATTTTAGFPPPPWPGPLPLQAEQAKLGAGTLGCRDRLPDWPGPAGLSRRRGCRGDQPRLRYLPGVEWCPVAASARGDDPGGNRPPWLAIHGRAGGGRLARGDLAGPRWPRDAAGMRIAMGAGSEVLGTPMRPQDVVGDVLAAEAEGFGSAWTVHFSRGVDALSVLAVAGTRTSRIDLGVGIVPTYPRHPLALAQQAATAQAFSGGRLTLGVGVSHRPVIEDLHGLAYQQPAAHMRDYLSVLVPLLREGSVCYRGNYYEVDGGFAVPGTSPVSVLVGALSPLMVQAAGELADGVVTWLAGPRTLGEQIVPRLHHSAAGQREGQAPPRVVAALPVALSADSAASRQAADGVFARYAGFDNYRRLLDREGVESPGALAVTGDEAAIEKQLGRLADAGVTELWPIIFPVGDDPGRSRRETRALLRALATTS